MKIYTKIGDGGSTSLIGGTKVSKSHIRINAYGTVDELNAFVGLIRDHLTDKSDMDILLNIQENLFVIGSLLASDPEKSRMKLPDLNRSDISSLEESMDRIDKIVPELKTFILPGGNAVISYCHIARCVCRRAERYVVELAATDNTPDLIIPYLNRLSDYFFMLARKISHEKGIQETPWNPRS